jgi:hypothetical protein
MDGYSALTDQVEPQNKYNETLSDDRHVIAHQTFPILLATGFEVPETYNRGVSDVISHKNADSDMKFVTWDSDLEASERLENRFERQMREISGYSPVIDGDLDHIGQVRNLRGAMVPDIITTRYKQLHYGQVEKEHAASTLRILEWHEDETFENKEMDITWDDAFVPVDDLTISEARAVDIKSGVENVKDIIKRMHPELETEAEVDKKFRENVALLRELGITIDPSGMSSGSERGEREQNSQ